MGYPIVFETKIIRLSDGRLLYLDLSGCNNDDCGRSRDEFTAKLYSEADFKVYAKNFMADSRPYKETGGFDLRIGNRYGTYYDYGAHLLRMLSRALSWDKFMDSGRPVSIRKLDYVKVNVDGEEKTMSVQEYEDFALKELYRHDHQYSAVLETTELKTESEVVEAIEKEDKLKIYIGRRNFRYL